MSLGYTWKRLFLVTYAHLRPQLSEYVSYWGPQGEWDQIHNSEYAVQCGRLHKDGNSTCIHLRTLLAEGAAYKFGYA